jgi:competence protein ComEA
MLPTAEIKDFFFRNRIFFLILLAGLTLIGLGIILTRVNVDSARVEVLEATTEALGGESEIVVEIAGEVQTPGVYHLPFGARIEDLLVAAGGIASNADRDWLQKSLNRAAKLFDGQKIYIPAIGEQSTPPTAKNGEGYQNVSANFSGQGSGLVNINASTLKELDALPGIGPVYGQSIIEHRPYSTKEELVSKGALKQSVFEKIKDLITVY